MENAVEKFDPSKLMDGVKDRIKSTFISLIPDGQWEQMVKNEIDDFINKRKKSPWSQETESKFSILVHETIAMILKDKIKKQLEEFIGNRYDEKITPALDKLIKENAESLISGMMGNMLRNAISLMNQQNHY